MSDDDNTDPNDPQDSDAGFLLKRCLLWAAGTLAIAFVLGLIFSIVPTRFRLLGLLAIVHGCGVGALAGRAAVPLRMHYPRISAIGGFAGGVVSVIVTAVLWWQAWSVEVAVPRKPDPNAALAAQMMAQMPKPDEDDTEQMEAYEESMRQLRGFLDAEAASPKVGFSDWLVHRASTLSGGWNVAVGLGLVELLLAGVVSAWLTKQVVQVPFCSDCQSWRSVIRSHCFEAPWPAQLKQMVSESSDQESDAAVTVELSQCGCDARPVVNLKFEHSRRSPDQRFDLSEEQFAEIKQLLDEAQGMK